MTTSLSAAVTRANFDVAQGCEFSRTPVRSKSLTVAVMQKAHDLWKMNIRLHLAEFAGVHPRTVDHWESGERPISTEAFLTLLDSKVGDDFFEIFMARLRPAMRQQWFDQQVLIAKLERADRKRAQIEQQSRQLRLELKR